MNVQRPTRRELIVQSLSHRLWETTPEKLTQILLQLPEQLIEELAATTIQVLEEKSP